ncbi:MAG: hypothetical protein KAT65_16105 [Methanophagales archaeon]|nr:hypothetical protein [Methanophagales archaeon]
MTVYCDKAVTSTVTNCVPSKVHNIQLVKIHPSELNLTSSLIGNSREEARGMGYWALLGKQL